jgi:hypothetical protein
MLPVFEPDKSTEVGRDKLALPKARQLAALLSTGLPFVRLLRFERQEETGIEAVITEVEVELGQQSVHHIQRFEPLAILFDPADRLQQQVLALRKGFPITPHQHLSSRPEPRSLCLYEEPYTERKTRWSAFGLLERAREWLRLTARGELHQEDQPLEPLLGLADTTAVLPHDFFDSLAGKDFIPAAAARTEGAANRFVLVLPQSQLQNAQTPEFVISLFVSSAVEHGIISHQPATLLQLHEFCQSASLDLLKELQDRIRRWKSAGITSNIAKSKLIICLAFPKLRRGSDQPESRETWLFVTRANLLELGTALGIFAAKKVDGFSGLILGAAPIETEATRQVLVLPMRPTFTLDRHSAATLNGTTPDLRKIVAVGLGALGSHVFDNLLKSGFGSWTLVDNDCLLPHNCARHVLDGSAIASPKVAGMRNRANNIVPDVSVATIVADVLNPGEHAEALKKSMQDADVILDMSASVAVSRHLALDCPAPARRACLFLNPGGDTLAVLIEDSSRTTPLDWLEMHYYRALTTDEAFANIFRSSVGFRYSRSCGDISSRISQDLVALHSAIGSRALRTGLHSEHATAVLYRAQADLSTKAHAIQVKPPLIETVEGWTVLSDSNVVAEAHRLRQTKLPNETGGVLLGTVDTNHRRIYVIDLHPSPSDSQEWPNLYIRGAAGLRNRIQAISDASYDNVNYVGEWHSHPPRCGPRASQTDRVALSKLAYEMRVTGSPAIMLIVAGSDRHQFHIRQHAEDLS